MSSPLDTAPTCISAHPRTLRPCGKPATWIGTARSGFRAGFCPRCHERGSDRSGIVAWEPIQAGEPFRLGAPVPDDYDPFARFDRIGAA